MALNLVKSWFEFLKNEARTITVEPILFLAAFGMSIVAGSQVTFNIYKGPFINDVTQVGGGGVSTFVTLGLMT